MSTVLHKLTRSEEGFTLAEVIIAMVLFVAAIIGIATMIMSGSGAVTRGAMENTATQLAQKKLEDVKSLAFYSPWTGIPNKDIDDYYWNPSCSGGYNDNVDQLTTEQPHTNTQAYEDYDKIPGFDSYKRTTAIQYQILTTTATTSQMTAAAMNTNWVPKPTDPSATKVVSPQFDSPAGGTPVGGATTSPSLDKIRFMTVEVRVSYHLGDNGQEKSYLARATVSDLMVTGGANNPLIVVKEIHPTQGTLNTDNLPMDITVQSEGLQADYDAGTAIVTTKLWYEGQDEIPCNESRCVVSGNGTNIACSFNLRSRSGVHVRAGMYSLEVYWQNKGWKDTSFRNCFTVIVGQPEIDSISNFTWGHKGQNLRQITVSGTSLDDCTIYMKRGSTKIGPGGVTSNDGSTVKANFDLTSISVENQYWDIEVTTVAGTASTASDPTNANRFYVNPKSVITRISDTSGTNYYRWAHGAQKARKIRIEGSYLYGYEDVITSNEKSMYYSSLSDGTTGKATWVSGPTGDEPDVTTPLVLTFNPNTSPVGKTVGQSYWTVHLKNYGGVALYSYNGGNTTSSPTDISQEVLFNPTPTNLAVARTVTPCTATSTYDWAHSGLGSRNVAITGNYIYGLTPATYTSSDAQMTYNNGTDYYTTSRNYTVVSEPTLNDEADTGSAIITFAPNTVNNTNCYYTTAGSKWNIRLKNYGGTANSDAMYSDLNKTVLMNPLPTVKSVSACGTTDGYVHYNWGYKAQSSRYVKITGKNIYNLANTDTQTQTQLTYTGGYNTAKGTVIDNPTGANCIVDTEIYVVMSFAPNSIVGSPALDKYWNVYVKNEGGASTLASAFYMNPKPVISGKGGFASPAKTGAASGQTNKTYTSLSLTGSYIQNGATKAYLVRGATAPTDASTYMNLSYGVTPTIATDGASISGLNMIMTVSPVTGFHSFMVWAGGDGTGDALDPNIQGTVAGGNAYYAYFINPDGQACAASAVTEDITHKQCTFTFGSYQNTASNTLFGKPTNTTLYCYQDGYVTNSATSNSGTNAIFKDWREGSTNLNGIETNQTFSGTDDRTITCRYKQYLYTTAIVVGWQQGKTDSPCEGSTNSGGWLWGHCWDSWGDTGEYANVTSSPLDLTGCSTVGWTWKQTDSGSGAHAYFVISGNQGADRNTYDKRSEHLNGTWVSEPRTMDISPWAGQSKYFRVHAENGGLNHSGVWCNQVYVE